MSGFNFIWRGTCGRWEEGGGRYWLKMKKTFLTLIRANNEGSEFPVVTGMQTVVTIIIIIIVTVNIP